MNAFTGFWGDLKNILIVLLLLFSGATLFNLYVKSNEIQELNLSLAISKTQLFECEKTLENQNAAIKNMELKKHFEPPDTGKIEKNLRKRQNLRWRA